MWPDDRILNSCPLLQKTTLAQHRINDLRAGLNLAVVSNYRDVINFGGRGRVKFTTALLQMNPGYAIGQQVLIHLQISLGRADVDPIGARRNVREERFFPFQQFREQTVLE